MRDLTIPTMRQRSALASPGFTIVELMLAVAIVGLIAGLAGTNYMHHVEKARVAKAVVEIASFSEAVEADRLFNKSPPPDSLVDAGLSVPIDPWGTPYRYLRIEGVFDVTQQSPAPDALPAVAAGARPQPDKPRKDRFFKPINTDFDLYSSGPNGDSRESLEHDDSRDDIVRGLNGRFVGPAVDF